MNVYIFIYIYTYRSDVHIITPTAWNQRACTISRPRWSSNSSWLPSPDTNWWASRWEANAPDPDQPTNKFCRRKISIRYALFKQRKYFEKVTLIKGLGSSLLLESNLRRPGLAMRTWRRPRQEMLWKWSAPIASREAQVPLLQILGGSCPLHSADGEHVLALHIGQ